MCSFFGSLRAIMFVLVAWLAVVATPANAADGFAIITGLADGKVGVALLNNLGEADRSKVSECAVADIQKALGRAPEIGDQLQFFEGDLAKCKVQSRTIKTEFWRRLLTILVCAWMVVVTASLAARGSPLKFLVGVDGRYSNSQCQLALWFGMAMTMYLSTVALRVHYLGWDYLGGVAMTANVMALTGLSALTFGAAKVVTSQKVEALVNAAATSAANAATAAGAAPATAINAGVVAADNAKLAAKPAGSRNILVDLFQNDHGDVDIGDFQMIFVTVSAAVIFGISCFISLENLPHLTHVSLPDVDSSLLAGFGIGQGAYLVKKAALPLGKG